MLPPAQAGSVSRAPWRAGVTGARRERSPPTPRRPSEAPEPASRDPSQARPARPYFFVVDVAWVLTSLPVKFPFTGVEPVYVFPFCVVV